MRVSRLFKPSNPDDPESIPTNRLGLWIFLFVAVIVGIVLFFLFGRSIPSIL